MDASCLLYTSRKRAPRARKIVRFRRGFIQMLFQKDFVALGQRLAHVARHQQKVVDAVFDRIREEDEKAHEGQAEEQP